MNKKKDRIPLNSGDELRLRFRAMGGQIYTQKVVIEEMIGSGASCLTYIARLFTDDHSSLKMIMKEFYPESDEESFQIRRTGSKLCVSDTTKNSETYRDKLEMFKKSFMIQSSLSNGEAMEVMVHPYHMAEYGDAFYILSDMHLGIILAKADVKNLSDKLWLIYRTAEAVQLLNEQGYLYMDLNPKNILWIPSQQVVKLFDVDSLIPFRKLENIHTIRVTYPYIPPEFSELEEWFDINKNAFLKPSWDVYCLGLVFYELLTGGLPSDEKARAGMKFEKEIPEICRQYGISDPDVAALIGKILGRSLSTSFRRRYPSAKEMCRDLNCLKKRLDAQEFITKKEYAQANNNIQSYHILEKWPVYEYAVQEDDRNIFDVAICGTQPMREAFFKAVFSCVHMPDSMLRIRLYSEDVRDFMKKLQTENPALIRTVHLYLEDKCIWNENDRIGAGSVVCKEPIAEIRLYEKSVEEMLSDDALLFRHMKSRYVLLLWEEEDKRRLAEEALPSETIVPPVSEKKKCSYYDEELFKTRILKEALNIHTFYYRGNHEKASKDVIRKSFENDIYCLNSSLRSALSIKYELCAVGIRADCKNPAEEFYRRVLTKGREQQKKLELLTALEHLSWCAYMVVNGWDHPTEEEIEEYAFTNENDFKEKEKKLHPCLVESRPGRGLKTWGQKEWDRQKISKKVERELDALDLASFRLHIIAMKKARESRPEVERLFAELDRRLQNYRFGELQEAFYWLETVKERVYAGESNAEIVWNHAYQRLSKICKKLCGCDELIQNSLSELYRSLKIVHEYNSFHDYKKSDEDIIKGIPQILRQGSIQRVVRPYLKGNENCWKNIMSTLFLEPDEVLFIPLDSGEIDLNFYKEFLKLRGNGAKLSVSRLQDAAEKTADVVVDVTGLSAEELILLDREPSLAGKRRVMVKNRRLIFLNSPFGEMYERKIHLTVEETFYLFGLYIKSEKRQNAILGLTSRYKEIWGAYREIGQWKWKMLIKQLVREEEENTYVLRVESCGRKKPYCTEPVSGRSLTLTGLDLVLGECMNKRLIQSYWLPGMEDELPVEFTTDRENIAQVLEDMVRKAGREPLKHKFVFCCRKNKKSGIGEGQREYTIMDKTLYVSGFIQKRMLIDPHGKSVQVGQIIEVGLKTLEAWGVRDNAFRQSILQNLHIVPTQKGIAFSFKYASEAVKECLQREENILEAMIYFTCLEMGIFDDLNINFGFYRNAKEGENLNEHIVNNGIDIIGTKNLKTYFISACTTVPTVSHIMEIKYFADHFGIDGQVVLVTANGRTVDEVTASSANKKERSSLMDVRYINRTVIDEGRLGEVLGEMVEKSF